MFGQRPQLEAQEFMDIELANLVLVVETSVLPFIGIPVDDALFGEKTAPQLVAVSVQEGVVQVKKRNTHRRFLM
jgi:hypothetical protein